MCAAFWQNRATNSLHNDTRLTIDLIDENDEIPQFVGLDENGRYPGSVAENLPPGAEVITVTATDKDEFPDFQKVCQLSPLRVVYCRPQSRPRFKYIGSSSVV